MASWPKSRCRALGLSINRQSINRTRILVMLALLVALWAPRTALSQTPSPLEEWQYSSGIDLQKLFEPDVPKWRVVLGAAAEARPLYEGAQRALVQGGPVINIRYRDLAFASVGEGLGAACNARSQCRSTTCGRRRGGRVIKEPARERPEYLACRFPPPR